MNRRIIVIFSFWIAAFCVAGQDFVHPEVLRNRAGIERMRYLIDNRFCHCHLAKREICFL